VNNDKLTWLACFGFFFLMAHSAIAGGEFMPDKNAAVQGEGGGCPKCECVQVEKEPEVASPCSGAAGNSADCASAMGAEKLNPCLGAPAFKDLLEDRVSVINDPKIGLRCLDLQAKRKEKIIVKQRLQGLLSRNQRLNEKTPPTDKSIKAKLVYTQLRIERQMLNARDRLREIEVELARSGCPLFDILDSTEFTFAGPSLKNKDEEDLKALEINNDDEEPLDLDEDSDPEAEE
jgi:hypothetical protein